MRETLSSIPTWAYLLATAGLAPLAAHFGLLMEWTPGAASLAILAVPTCAASLSGNRMAAMLVALLAALGCFVEAYFAASAPADTMELGFPLFSAGVLIVLSIVSVAVIEHMQNSVSQLEQQNDQYVRQLYQRNRDHSDSTLAATSTGTKQTIEPKNDDEDSVNLAMLLLTLQDVGRRISSDLELETLIPTIVGSAKSSLKCDDCQIYLWNSAERQLKNALPERPRDRTDYVPKPNIGMAKWVLEYRQILTRKTIEQDYEFRALKDEEPEMPDAIAPLSIGGELLGLLVIDKTDQDSRTFARMLYILADLFALSIKNAQLFKRIVDMARRDGLTGLLNHASFHEELHRLIDDSASNSTTLTVVMSDIDHFKKFNDTYGHQAGDHVLREVSRLWTAVLPDHAILARYGGEEFICVLPQDELARGEELAELLRQSTELHTLDFKGQELHVTSSFGVAQLQSSAELPQDLIRRADEALYRAKEMGRNGVVCSPMSGVIANSIIER